MTDRPLSSSSASPPATALPAPPADAAASGEFAPLFTLVTNASTRTTIHPRVHYIFADDDPPPLPRAPDRALLLDLAPAAATDPAVGVAAATPSSAWRVARAASLSADFAVVDARITEAPPRGGDPMLQIEGVEREPLPPPPPQLPPSDEPPEQDSAGAGGASASTGAVGGREDAAALADQFRKRMVLIRRVVAASTEERAATRPKDEEDAQLAAAAAAPDAEQD